MTIVLTRRSLLAALQAGGLSMLGARSAFAAALAKRPLAFPRDYGSHPDSRTEWWYITGHARAKGNAQREFGFQVTFFRSRIDATASMRSKFAARQLIFAHAAVTDLQGATLLHDQRIARDGMNVASASEADTAVRIRDWSLNREQGRYLARIPAGAFSLDLQFAPTQAVLLQGDAGLSRKGPAPDEASYYYSEPQLKAQGRIDIHGRGFDIEGTAWLDHEWSETLMSPDAVGWDWIGMNLSDGSALTAFRLRNSAGRALWAGGSWRSASGQLRVFKEDEVSFEPVRTWKSPATQASYPVEWKVRTPSGMFVVKSLLDNQELDSRGSTGAVYWEGVSDLLDERGTPVGRGYLEMTGYVNALRL